MTNSSPFIGYQTEHDLNREKQIITFLSKKWNFEFQKMGLMSVFDYECFRDGELISYVEVKTKNCNFKDFDTYICTMQDIDWGYNRTKSTGIPSFIVVKWFDFFGYLKINRNDYKFRKSGQKNRNDPRDYDTLCYLIPMSEFKEIKGFKFND